MWLSSRLPAYTNQLTIHRGQWYKFKAAFRDGLWKTFVISKNVLNRTGLSLEQHPVIS